MYGSKKWTNKGHEYDEVGKRFKPNMKVWIYGAGENGLELFKRLGFADCVDGFIDNSLKSQADIYGKKVVSFVEFMNYDHENVIVVVAGSMYNTIWMKNQLREVGYEEGVNLFDYHSFRKYWLPIFAMYSWNKLYFHDTSIVISTYCNLSCKHCLQFTPYNKGKRNYDIKMLKKTLDLTFNAVDYIGLIDITGGEALLIEELLIDILEYIGENYRKKIGHLNIITNGTIVPSERLCCAIKNNNVFLKIDDYTDSIGEEKSVVHDIERRAQERDIDYEVNKVDTWIDLALGKTDNSIYSEKELQSYYVACQQECLSLSNGRVVNCAFNDYAIEAKLVEEQLDEVYDLRNYTPEDRMVLFEFSRGYSEKGYMEMCKKCAGFFGINRNSVKVAEQNK